MSEVHHFAYGYFNPIAAFVLAFLGSLLGLVCTARARHARTAGRRARWLLLASLAIGGTGIWLMHFMAIIGFDVPHSPVRFDPVITFISLVLAVLTVGVGLFIAAQGDISAVRIVTGGGFTGLGVVAMHYTGMAAMRVAGTIAYDPGLVGASVAIAVTAATVALWFAVTVRKLSAISGAAVVMAVAVCGMHYTAMAAVRVQLGGDGRVAGISPFVLIVPIVLLAALGLITTLFSALQAMTQEEFEGEPSRPRHRMPLSAVVPTQRVTGHAAVPRAARVGR
ncbi:MHYT domain-containing protein [Catellatospora tritici]|uniref:MHYT domain-containing protein n=1 Tax=Catellatospora tritici TaxID=2851566 RepID=UPI001C2D42D9|nr:MHYT domain-containing protein [Catellatospora tritici]MBV1854179.1 histidine kinase [Catellatospora tritici]